MTKWETIEITSGVINANELGKFEVYTDESYIYFKRKHYAVIDITVANNTKVYKAECVRHTGHRHIKYETTFVVTSKAIGYSEILSIEV